MTSVLLFLTYIPALEFKEGPMDGVGTILQVRDKVFEMKWLNEAKWNDMNEAIPRMNSLYEAVELERELNVSGL